MENVNCRHNIKQQDIKEGMHYLPVAKVEHYFVKKVQNLFGEEKGFKFKLDGERATLI